MRTFSERPAGGTATVSAAAVTQIAAITLAFLVTVAAPSAQAQQSLSFSNFSIESGIDLQENAVYRFDDVTIGVDALITIDAYHGGASLTQIDNASPSGANLTPQLSGTPANSPDPQVDLRITFVTADTSTPIVLDTVFVSPVDIDGTATRREFAILDGFDHYVLESDPPTELTVSTVTQGTQFTASTSDYGGTSPDTTWVAVTAAFVSVSEISMSIGQTGTAGSAATRVSSIHFTPGIVPFSQPDTTFSTLPVELAAIDAFAGSEPGSAVIRWTAASEVDVLGYEVEGRKGSSNAALGFVQATGTPAGPADYVYNARHLAPGNWSFRLRMIDIDGSSEYSPSVEVAVTSAAQGALRAVYPNPASSRATATLDLAQSGWVDVSLFDVTGRRVRQFASRVMEAGTHELSVAVDALPPGFYVFRLQTERSAEVMPLVVVE